ncbi:ATP-dependent DNA helicase [Trichonephila clavipes]|nr:ATP-dependent DNA helicase [Trichonephila clavipes]
MVNRLPRNIDDDYYVNVHIKRRKNHKTSYLMAQQQTLLWNEEKYIRITPGEANIPRSLLFDEHAEELSFPAIYLETSELIAQVNYDVLIVAELPHSIWVLDESRSFFRVHTGYFSNIPKCIKAEFIASWGCSQSSVVSSSKR